MGRNHTCSDGRTGGDLALLPSTVWDVAVVLRIWAAMNREHLLGGCQPVEPAQRLGLSGKISQRGGNLGGNLRLTGLYPLLGSPSRSFPSEANCLGVLVETEAAIRPR